MRISTFILIVAGSINIVFMCLVDVVFSQSKKTTVIIFNPVYGNSKLDLNGTYYKLTNDDSLQIETLKFYISNIEFLNNGKVVWKEENSYHLIDASNDKTLRIPFNNIPVSTYNKISFDLGIDSLTNVSGALGGDLDPTKGMYWTWQNGYINFKQEGKSNLCRTRNNEFQFHLGGYQSPFSTLQTVSLEVKETDRINIELDLKKFIAVSYLSKQNQIMSPCSDAVYLSKRAANAFSIKKP